MNRQDIYTTPLFTVDLSLVGDLHERLVEDCYSWQSETSGVQVSNQGGWHSDASLFKRKEESFCELSKLIIEHVTVATRNVAPELQGSELRWQCNGWVNINSGLAFNAPHDHPGFTWSGVYYVKTPISGNFQPSYLEFLDPRNSVSATAGSNRELQKFYAKNRRLEPKNGLLVIFPSYLVHWVYPNQALEDRISIAFNARLAPSA